MDIMPIELVQGYEQEGAQEETQEGTHDESYHPKDHVQYQASDHQQRMGNLHLGWQIWSPLSHPTYT